MLAGGFSLGYNILGKLTLVFLKYPAQALDDPNSNQLNRREEVIYGF